MQASIMQPYTERTTRRTGTRRRLPKRVRRMITTLLLALAILLLAPRAVDMLARSEAPAVVTYRVAPGDTLWAIAEQHSSGGDVRELIYAIKQANHLKTATVRPGQELVIPKR